MLAGTAGRLPACSLLTPPPLFAPTRPERRAGAVGADELAVPLRGHQRLHHHQHGTERGARVGPGGAAARRAARGAAGPVPRVCGARGGAIGGSQGGRRCRLAAPAAHAPLARGGRPAPTCCWHRRTHAPAAPMHRSPAPATLAARPAGSGTPPSAPHSKKSQSACAPSWQRRWGGAAAAAPPPPPCSPCSRPPARRAGPCLACPAARCLACPAARCPCQAAACSPAPPAPPQPPRVPPSAQLQLRPPLPRTAAAAAASRRLRRLRRPRRLRPRRLRLAQARSEPTKLAPLRGGAHCPYRTWNWRSLGNLACAPLREYPQACRLCIYATLPCPSLQPRAFHPSTARLELTANHDACPLPHPSTRPLAPPAITRYPLQPPTADPPSFLPLHPCISSACRNLCPPPFPCPST